MLALGPQRSWRVPVVRTEAANGEGVAELLETIDEHRAHIEEEGTLDERRARNLRAEVLGIAAARMRRELEQRAEQDPEWAELLDSVVSARDGPGDRRAQAARKIARWLRQTRARRPAAEAQRRPVGRRVARRPR